MEEKRKSLAEIPAAEGDLSFKSINKCVRYVFPPEDVEKMKGMTSKERCEYKRQLIDEGKYTMIVKKVHK